MRENLKKYLALFIVVVSIGNPVQAAFSLGFGLGSFGLGLSLPETGGEPRAPEVEAPPTGLANTLYVRGNFGHRLIDSSDALPYYDAGQFHLPPDPQGELGHLGGFGLGFMWHRGVSFELGLDLGPRRSFVGDIVHQNGQVQFKDYTISMNVHTVYSQISINWLVPLFPPKQYLLFGLGGRLGYSSMNGAVSIHQNFPAGPGILLDGGHDVSANSFSQGLTGHASWLVTPWLSLDLEGMYENMVFTRISIRNGRGYLAGIEKVQPFDTTGMGAPMTWNFSGPSFRGGITFYFKTPIAALRAPRIARQVSEEDQRLSEKQRQSGDALLKASLLPEAFDAYKSALKKNSGNAHAWYGLGNVYYRQKNIEKALSAYEKSLALDPENKVLASYVNRLKVWMMKKKGQLK